MKRGNAAGDGATTTDLLKNCGDKCFWDAAELLSEYLRTLKVPQYKRNFIFTRWVMPKSVRLTDQPAYPNKSFTKLSDKTARVTP